MTGGDTIRSYFATAGLSQNTGDVVTSEIIEGQIITIGVGSLTAAVDASSPVSALVVANTMPKVASFKFTGSNDSFTITELAAKVASSNDAAAITELVFKNGATEIARVPFVGIYATATGITVSIPSNGNEVIDVYANLSSVGTGFADSGANVGVTLVSYEAQNSGGGETSYDVNLSGNNTYVFKTKPVITNVALPTTVLTPGVVTVAKVNITTDAGGTLAWRKLVWTIATSSSENFFISSFNLYDAADQSTVLANTTVSLDQDSGKIVVTSTSDQEISGSKTYVLKAMVEGTVTTGASISTTLTSSGLGFTAPTDAATSQATEATFVWSDESIVGHDVTTSDWMNDYLVKNLPTDSQALTK
jgi:hypothetical protein